MRNTWLNEQLTKITEPQYAFIIQEAVNYIEQLEDDNESLQISLEGTIWSPKKWREPSQNSSSEQDNPEAIMHKSENQKEEPKNEHKTTSFEPE